MELCNVQACMYKTHKFDRVNLRRNSLTAILVEVSGNKLESSQTGVCVWFCTLIFPFYKMLLMNRIEFFCYADFFVRIIDTKVEYGFL